MSARTLVLSALGLCLVGVGFVLTSDQFGRRAVPAQLEAHIPVSFEPPMRDQHRAEFTICSGPVRANCVVDGDTFWFKGTKIRVADIDAPEISEPDCAGEAQAGEMAKTRLLDLLNAGRFRLISSWRDQDSYGRKLRIVAREDISLGEMLVREGLARPWGGPDFGWCNGPASTAGVRQ
ncbi:thermonuclease family protein [Mesorhizobium xinjiangense]|uniref:thermonuclease family protein n=1 Tax=Mesorhizobium xinjiangense TaxID=2678685 RepID=UPI0012EEB7D5|nr:thermonuclease family protein [Mesorhizobium xinjiangense]